MALTAAPADNAIYHLVFLRAGPVLLVRRPDPDWSRLQDEFPDFMTSLGPMTADEATEWLAEEYGADEQRDAAIRAFVEAREDVLTVLDCDPVNVREPASDQR
jgi:hypothetical protein